MLARVLRLIVPVTLCLTALAATGQEALPAGDERSAASQPIVWAAADLGLVLPAGWSATESIGESGEIRIDALASNDSGDFTAILTEPTPENPLPLTLLDQLLAARGAGRYVPVNTIWFGDVARRTDAGSVTGLVGRLPDHRILTAIGSEPDFDAIIHSFSASAQNRPAAPQYGTAWAVVMPAPPETQFDDRQTQITAVAASTDRIYATSPAVGVAAFDRTGALLLATPFSNPSQPTGMAVISRGVLVADTVCRCLQLLSTAGQWGDTVGAFGGNAPARAAGDGSDSVYAVDRSPDGFSLAVIRDGDQQQIPLNFNAGDVPLIAPGPEQTYVIEWLQSLIDGTLSAGLSTWRTGDASVEFGLWLPFGAGELAAAAQHPDGWLALATDEGRVLQVGADGNGIPLAQLPVSPTDMAFTPDGDIVISTTDERVRLLSLQAIPDRMGAEQLVPDVPVVGRLNAWVPRQTWTLNGSAGDIISLFATDLQRRDTFDMSLRVFAPDGSEIAFNDDQRGTDLWSAFDSAISSLTLPADGRYTVVVESVQNTAGEYVLAYTAERRFVLEDQAVTLTGALSDVIPVQRWAFAGQQGQTITITMRAVRGDLDPLLTLRLADGRLLERNDDGADPELGTDAQIFRVTLPRTETYYLEASRFNFTGAGDYSLVIFVG